MTYTGATTSGVLGLIINYLIAGEILNQDHLKFLTTTFFIPVI
jgi:hypothetical protein